jgi:hypothetical protein
LGSVQASADAAAAPSSVSTAAAAMGVRLDVIVNLQIYGWAEGLGHAGESRSAR